MKKQLFLVVFIGLISLIGPIANAAEEIPPELKGVGITEHLGDQLDLNLEFTNEQGKRVLLKNYFKGDLPVILNLVYYECPMLCTFVLNGMTSGISNLKWSVGDKFRVITLSIDPTETPDLALQKKKAYLGKYGRANTESQWHFLVGSDENIRKLANEVGFGYRYDPEQKEYAHSAATFVLTPDGKISRYLYGVQYEPRDIKLALLEASKGKIGNVVDRLLMFCYHYDPKGKKYALFATNLMKGAGGITVLGIGLMIAGLSWRKRNKKIKN